MGFYTDLQAMKLRFSSKYYDMTLANNYELKELIDNNIAITELWARYPLAAINSIDDYYNYLFAEKVIAFENTIEELTLSDSEKIILKNLIVTAKSLIANIKPKALIDFINNNIENLITPSIEPYGLSNVDESTLDYVIKYKSGFGYNIKKKICKNMGKAVIQRYEEFESIIMDDDSLFDELFPQKDLECAEKLGFNAVLVALTRMISKEGTSLCAKAEQMINALTAEVLNLCSTLTADNVLIHEHIIREYISFLCRISHVDANKFVKTRVELERLISESVKNNGKTITISVPITPILERLSESTPLLSRILSITHESIATENRLKCRLDVSPIPCIVDEIATATIPTNSFFTVTHQQRLDRIVTSGAVIIDTVFSDDNLAREILGGCSQIMRLIATETNSDVDELVTDFNLLQQMMGTIYFSVKDEDEIVMNSLCYGAAMFICALSEKVLRYCYFEEAKDYKYVPLNKATIGTLLDINNEEMKAVLGEYQLRHLNYYFGQDKDGLVGCSYRNRLAHWNEITNNYLKPQFVCKLLYLFISIINSVSIYYCEKDKAKETSVDEKST